jgi:hypothetical protein
MSAESIAQHDHARRARGEGLAFAARWLVQVGGLPLVAVVAVAALGIRLANPYLSNQNQYFAQSVDASHGPLLLTGWCIRPPIPSLPRYAASCSNISACGGEALVLPLLVVALWAVGWLGQCLRDGRRCAGG